jgi:tRNA wybutosine-synthesizing protein 1
MHEKGMGGKQDMAFGGMIDADVKAVLERQRYKIVGRHSAVKLCTWTKKSIMGKGVCYKQQFYGVESHRCLQMTPAVSWCTQKCIFCWRNVEQTIGSDLPDYDEPGDIIDGAIAAQKKLLTGYGGVLEMVDAKKHKEAQNPNQAAVSLSGEPTLYPEIGSLLEEFKKKNFTTFLVTNGTLPERLAGLQTLPTQLYLSMVAPDEKTYIKVCNPASVKNWEKIQETIKLFPSLDTRKAVRITAVKDLNMFSPDKYAKMIEVAEPDYVEVKAYMFIGGSRMRLSLENMPSFPDIWEFAEGISKNTGYQIKDHKRDSRVVLLSKN